jgi:hypothetical protein
VKVEQSYVIVAVSHIQEVGDVELVLTGLFQETQSQLMVPVAKGTSDEEQVMQKVMAVAGRFVREQQGLGVNRIRLPFEKYEELGKPTIMDTLNITIEFEDRRLAKVEGEGKA